MYFQPIQIDWFPAWHVKISQYSNCIFFFIVLIIYIWRYSWLIWQTWSALCVFSPGVNVWLFTFNLVVDVVNVLFVHFPQRPKSCSCFGGDLFGNKEPRHSKQIQILTWLTWFTYFSFLRYRDNINDREFDNHVVKNLISWQPHFSPPPQIQKDDWAYNPHNSHCQLSTYTGGGVIKV